MSSRDYVVLMVVGLLLGGLIVWAMMLTDHAELVYRCGDTGRTEWRDPANKKWQPLQPTEYCTR